MTPVDYLPLFTEIFGAQLIEPSKLPRASRSGFSGDTSSGTWFEWHDGTFVRTPGWGQFRPVRGSGSRTISIGARAPAASAAVAVATLPQLRQSELRRIVGWEKPVQRTALPRVWPRVSLRPIARKPTSWSRRVWTGPLARAHSLRPARVSPSSIFNLSVSHTRFRFRCAHCVICC